MDAGAGNTDSKAESKTAVSNILDINQVMKMLPHRYPLLMVDRLIEVTDVSAIGIKNISVNEPFFQGHFPLRPVMPGVLIIESMAQTAACLVVNWLGENAHGKLVYFMSIDKARFRKPMGPGDQVHVHVKMIQRRGSVWRFEGRAMVDGTLCAEATYTAMILDER
jgi:3-hydroxyacyl-[acyl-carrier-protein] dehydratase